MRCQIRIQDVDRQYILRNDHGGKVKSSAPVKCTGTRLSSSGDPRSDRLGGSLVPGKTVSALRRTFDEAAGKFNPLTQDLRINFDATCGMFEGRFKRCNGNSDSRCRARRAEVWPTEAYCSTSSKDRPKVNDGMRLKANCRYTFAHRAAASADRLDIAARRRLWSRRRFLNSY